MKLLRALIAFQERNGYMPRLVDLCALVGVSSTNGITDKLRRLERDGFIVRPNRLASGGIRPIVVTDAGRALAAKDA